VLSTIQLLCLTLKKILAQIIAQQKEIMHILKVRKKRMSQKIAQREANPGQGLRELQTSF